jgi:polyphosphate glucokinase
LEKHGKVKWQKFVADVVKRLIAALEPDDVVLGGGNIHKLEVLPPGCRAGDNDNAFRGGFRLWTEADPRQGSARTTHRPDKREGTQGGARKKTKGSPA